MHSRKRRRKLQFLITAGGTREYIDPVRFISNASSGKMGYELARAAAAAGHKVTLITRPSCLSAPAGVRIVNVETSAEMFGEVRKCFGKSDCLIMAAAVSDYAPIRAVRLKMKKGNKTITLKLKPTPDILKWAGVHKKVKSKKEKGKKQIVVGFALEDKDLRSNAERKMRDKNLDMIVANTPAAIGSDSCEVWVKGISSQWRRVPRAPKWMVARRLIRLIEQLILAD
jgi:phosphopantothenoylcysteine decarboxylase/phosphopantothenate--cysteine ligase